MKIVLYSPYFPKHVGGGEMYLLQVATGLVKLGHEVWIAITTDSNGEPLPEKMISVELSKGISKKYETFSEYDLSAIKYCWTPLGTKASIFSKLAWTKQWERLYYLTDGSLFFSLAQKNVLHIQFPFILDKSGFIEQKKLANWQVKNTNSKFTKSIVEESWPVTIDYVHWPYVHVADTAISTNKKEKIILHVGRFFSQLHSKRQDFLVQAFAELLGKHPKESKGWKLVLVGSVEDKAYADRVKELAKGLPVEIHHQVSRGALFEWYKKASLYWHATGEGVDEGQHPEKVEHFGISTIEAMAFGCVPVVINKGGQPEVVGKELNSLLWNTSSELIDDSLSIMTDDKKRRELSKIAQKRSHFFSEERFLDTLQLMIK